MPSITLTRGATRPPLEATLRDAAGETIDLSTATQVRFRMGDPSERVIDARATIVAASDGQVRYVWQRGDTETARTYKAAFYIRFADGSRLWVPSGGESLTVDITPSI
jgi:hypothetical protein